MVVVDGSALFWMGFCGRGVDGWRVAGVLCTIRNPLVDHAVLVLII